MSIVESQIIDLCGEEEEESTTPIADALAHLAGDLVAPPSHSPPSSEEDNYFEYMSDMSDIGSSSSTETEENSGGEGEDSEDSDSEDSDSEDSDSEDSDSDEEYEEDEEEDMEEDDEEEDEEEEDEEDSDEDDEGGRPTGPDAGDTMALVCRALGKLPDPAVGTAITGNLDLPSLRKLLHVLTTHMAEPFRKTEESSLMDLGSGVGYVLLALCMPTSGFSSAIGVELDPTIHATSVAALQRIRGALPWNDVRERRVSLVLGNVCDLPDFSGCSHVHTFAFSFDVLVHIARLLVKADAADRPKCVSIVHGKESELKALGFVPSDAAAREALRADRLLKTFTVAMPSGDKHGATVVAITDERVAAMRAKLEELEHENEQSAAASPSACFIAMRAKMSRATRLLGLDDLEYDDFVDAADPVELMSPAPKRARRLSMSSMSSSMSSSSSSSSSSSAAAASAPE